MSTTGETTTAEILPSRISFIPPPAPAEVHATKAPEPWCGACRGGLRWAATFPDLEACLCVRPASLWPRGRRLGSRQELLTYRWGRLLFINGGFAGDCGQWAHLTRAAAAPKPRSHLR